MEGCSECARASISLARVFLLLMSINMGLKCSFLHPLSIPIAPPIAAPSAADETARAAHELSGAVSVLTIAPVFFFFSCSMKSIYLLGRLENVQASNGPFYTEPEEKKI